MTWSGPSGGSFDWNDANGCVYLGFDDMEAAYAQQMVCWQIDFSHLLVWVSGCGMLISNSVCLFNSGNGSQLGNEIASTPTKEEKIFNLGANFDLFRKKEYSYPYLFDSRLLTPRTRWGQRVELLTLLYEVLAGFT